MNDRNLLLLLGGVLALLGIFFTFKDAREEAQTDNARSPQVEPTVVDSGGGGGTIVFSSEESDPAVDLGSAGVVEFSFRQLYEKWGARYGVDPDELNAIAIVESSENPQAVNPSDPSTGLMQVLCDADGPDSPCKNRFNVVGWDEATPNRLFDPDFNVSIAAQILSWNQENFGRLRGIAMYNAFFAKDDPPDGPFRNQAYVDKVLGVLSQIRG